jgi:succinate dehydrogenase / fumarate reductase cytochrome b subunit
MNHAEERSTSSFMFARLGSLLSLLPLGVWTVWHVWENLSAFQGAEAWERDVTYHRHPVSFALLQILVFLPLLIHLLWGFKQMAKGRPNNLRYKYFSNLRYLLQRLAALGVLGFIAAHVWLAFLRPRLLLGHSETFADISSHMHHHVPTFIVYLLGTLGVAYHLGNGLQGFAMYWGLVIGRKAERRLQVVSIGFAVLMLAMSWAVLFAMYRAGASYPPPPM